MLNGLNEKFDHIINVIKHQKPFPTFEEARNMLELEETRLKKPLKGGAASHNDTPSLSTALVATTKESNQQTVTMDNWRTTAVTGEAIADVGDTTTTTNVHTTQTGTCHPSSRTVVTTTGSKDHPNGSHIPLEDHLSVLSIRVDNNSNNMRRITWTTTISQLETSQRRSIP